MSNRYPERFQNFATLHEIEHITKQHDQSVLYTATVQARMEMEAEANNGAIRQLVQDYVDITGLEPEELNYITFMKQNGISFDYVEKVKEVIGSYSPTSKTN